MKKATILGIAIFFAGVLLYGVAGAQDQTPGQPMFKQPAGPQMVQGKPQRFYGYVPPPPIRHTWPGGYRVIRYELSGTMSNHIAGHY